MKLSLALASAFGLLFSQGQGVVTANVSFTLTMATVVLDGDGCDNLECGNACYELSDPAKSDLAKISRGKGSGGDDFGTVFVDHWRSGAGGEFWKIGVCNRGGQCVTDVSAASASCDDAVNDATVYAAVTTTIAAAPYGGIYIPTLGSSVGWYTGSPSTGVDGLIINDLRKRAVRALGTLLDPDTSEEFVEAAKEALKSLVIDFEVPLFGECEWGGVECWGGV